MTTVLKQYMLTPSAGKRVIAKALVTHPAMQSALKTGTVVIIAGTTNGYVAEEVLESLGQAEGFSRSRFFRGVTLPPTKPTSDSGRLPDASTFPGDVAIVNGVWQQGKTIFDVVDDLKEGDIILKGANAVDINRHKAGIYIGHPKGGTIGEALQVVVGRRVRLILPVGVEKRIVGDLDEIAHRINLPGAKGPRMLTVTGDVYTELDAIAHLTGADVELIAGGGVCGAEGCCWFAVSGSAEQLEQADAILKPLAKEVPFSFN